MRIFTIAAILFMAITGFAQNTTTTESSLTSFLTYEVPNQVSSTIGNGVIGVIVPQGTNLATLVPSFTLDAGATATINDIAQVSGTTVVDFSNGPVTYKVTAEDGVTTQDWVVTVSVESGIDADAQLQATIYPNPANEYVIVENAENATITIYNVLGTVVSQSVSNQTNYQVSLSKLAKGTYLVNIQKGPQQITKKLSVVK
ncbi:MAG: T9SS type A sorting domain-containing protein [Salinivirgaceae bacterium]|nr:T9SS type A sorting domain-containing protein [Salinivirgaceae bacterium]